MLQRHAVQILHYDERLPPLLIDLMNGANIGMIQSRGSLSLALKPGKCGRILGNFIRKELQRDKPAEFYVLGLINPTHPTTAELLKNAVVRNHPPRK